MKIQYLKATHDSQKGEIKEVADPAAQVLIALGYATQDMPSSEPAEHIEKTPKKPRKSAKTLESE